MPWPVTPPIRAHVVNTRGPQRPRPAAVASVAAFWTPPLRIVVRRNPMARRKPPKLGVLLMVRHPESEDPEDHCTDLEGNPIYGPVDSDGHYIDFQVGRMGGTELAEVELRRGMRSEEHTYELQSLRHIV